MNHDDDSVGRDPIPLSQSLDALMRSLSGGPRSVVAGVFGRWDEAVGDAVARHAQPVKVERGRLLVEVDEPGWATQLRFLEHDILERLRQLEVHEVTGLEVRVRRSADVPGSSRRSR
jgi:predicted nucleic acid-binding Zn ribbon protein